MDGERFDRLAKALAHRADRRRLLRSLAGGLAATGGLGWRPAAARPAKQSLCHATGDPAHPWVVIDVAAPAWESHFAHGDRVYVDCCSDADCTGGATCGVEGTCVCPARSELCGGACVDTSCAPTEVFDPTTCACACPIGTTLCNGVCGECCTDADCPNSFACDPTSQTCFTGCAAHSECAAGRICANGRCAIECATSDDCPDHCEFCTDILVDSTGHLVCLGPSLGTPCEPDTHASCPTGTVCAGTCEELCL